MLHNISHNQSLCKHTTSIARSGALSSEPRQTVLRQRDSTWKGSEVPRPFSVELPWGKSAKARTQNSHSVELQGKRTQTLPEHATCVCRGEDISMPEVREREGESEREGARARGLFWEASETGKGGLRSSVAKVHNPNRVHRTSERPSQAKVHWAPPDLCLPRCVFRDCPCIW